MLIIVGISQERGLLLNAFRTFHLHTAAALKRIREEVMIALSFFASIIVLDTEIVIHKESVNAKKIISEKIAVYLSYL